MRAQLSDERNADVRFCIDEQIRIEGRARRGKALHQLCERRVAKLLETESIQACILVGVEESQTGEMRLDAQTLRCAGQQQQAL